jgi:hypothetical protein
MVVQKIITPSNLGADFRGTPGNKVVNDVLIGGIAATPAAPPAEVAKSWLYINTLSNRITHYWSPSGAAWVSLAESISPDFWRSGTGGTTQPDGATDATEAIARVGGVLIGAADPTTATSTLDVVGSFGTAITSTTVAAYTVVAADYTVVLSLAGAQAVTLPAAATSTRRTIQIVNPTPTAKTITSYNGLNGVSSTAIAANSAVTLQSNGTAWIATDTGSLPAAPAADYWRTGAGATVLPDGVTDLTENIRRNGNVGINVDPLYTLDNNGSLGLAVRRTQAATDSFSATDTILIADSATAQTINFPSNLDPRRVWILSNPTAIGKTTTGILDEAGGTITGIPPFTTFFCVADGGNRRLLLRSTHPSAEASTWNRLTTTSASTNVADAIYHTGNVTVGDTTAALARIHSVNTAANSSQGAFSFSNGTAVDEGTLLSANGTITEIKLNNGNSAHYTLSNDGAFKINNTSANTGPYTAGVNLVTVLPGGNVGIGTTTPGAALQVNNNLPATNTVNADAQALVLSRPSSPSIKNTNVAQFNLGSFSGSDANASTRLDLALNAVGLTPLTNIMTWLANGNVGVGTTAPTTTLDVNGSFGTNIVPTAAATYAFGPNDHTVVLTATTSQAVTLPPIGSLRREVAVVNPTNVAKTFVTRQYQDLTGGFTLVIPANSSMILQSDGAGWVLLSKSTLDAAPSDFWRSGAGGTTLPDGATDLTESIRRTGNVGIGVDPATTLDVNGSFGTSIVNAPDPTYTFASTDHTVVLTATTSQTVTLPGVVSPRRVVAVVNATNVAKTFGPARRYRDLGGNIADVIPANSSMILHNNGGEWMLLSLSTLGAPSDFWRSGAGTVLPDGTTDTTEFVSRTGDVAIGTTTVAGRLTVNGGDQLGGNINPAANLVSLHLTSGNGVGGSGGSLVFGANSGAWNFAGLKGVLANGTGAMGHLAFSTRRVNTDASLTEAMRITDTGRVGIGTTDPLTTLDVSGSFSTNLSTTAAATYTVANNDHTVVLTAGVSQAVTLPAAAASTRREIAVVNTANIAKTFAGPQYQDLDGSFTLVIPANSSMILQSNGAGWSLVSKSTIPTTYTPDAVPRGGNTSPAGIIPAGATSYSDADGNYQATITLPTAVGRRNQVFTIFHEATFDVTLLGTNKSPSTSTLITPSNRTTQYISDGANWVALPSSSPQTVAFASPAIAAVTPAGTTLATASDYISITVPSAGVWDIDFAVRGAVLSANGGIAAALTDSANAAVSRTVMCTYSQTAVNVQGTGTGKARVTTTGAQTFKVRVWSLNAASSGQVTSAALNGESWATATQIR